MHASIHVHTHARTHARIHAHTHTYTHTRTHIHTHTHTHTYKHTHTHTHKHTHKHTHTLFTTKHQLPPLVSQPIQSSSNSRSCHWTTRPTAERTWPSLPAVQWPTCFTGCTSRTTSPTSWPTPPVSATTPRTRTAPRFLPEKRRRTRTC